MRAEPNRAHAATAGAALLLALALGSAPGCGKRPGTSGMQGALEMGGVLPGAAAPPLEPSSVTAATGGGTAEFAGKVVKVSFPRTDTPVQIDGWSNVPPFMGLTSYTAFMPAENGKVIMMGDLVLFADEVNPAMSAALDSGLEVTALHNHFFFDKPAVYFMHVGGVGSVPGIGQGVKATLAAASAVRQSSSRPRETSGIAAVRTPSQIDPGTLDAAFGLKGKTQDGMYKATFGRAVTEAMCGGCTAGSAMGMNTWAAFAGADDDAVVDGDFAVTETELQPVLRTLRAGGINIVAIHSHVMGETPRMFFLHYWGRGASADLAKTVKAAVDKTAWEGAR
jgi:Domain of Unknown Function (DUF1259)